MSVGLCAITPQLNDDSEYEFVLRFFRDDFSDVDVRVDAELLLDYRRLQLVVLKQTGGIFSRSEYEGPDPAAACAAWYEDVDRLLGRYWTKVYESRPTPSARTQQRPPAPGVARVPVGSESAVS